MKPAEKNKKEPLRALFLLPNQINFLKIKQGITWSAKGKWILLNKI